MSRVFWARPLWGAAIGLLLLSGCYTVIMHPRVEDERPDGDRLRVECVDCHVDYHVYPYDPYDHYFGADYYWTQPHYGYYYGYPWWWDDYYWYYYFSPDDPDNYPADPRDVSRAAYRGGVPPRMPTATVPDGRTPTATEGRTLFPPGRSTTDNTLSDTPDTSASEPTDARSVENLIPIPESQREVGQPPWQRPTGGTGIKPPALRRVLPEGTAPVAEPVAPKDKDNGTIVVPTRPEDKKTEPEPPQQEEPKPRGKPGRNPQ